MALVQKIPPKPNNNTKVAFVAWLIVAKIVGILIIKKANFDIPSRKLFIILLKRTIGCLVLLIFGFYVYCVIVMVDCFQSILRI